MYGVLEDQFSKDMTQKDAIALAAKALLASAQRDSASGNGMDLAVITMKDGYVQLNNEEISEVLANL
jgi:proteasome beta subunit